MILLKKIAVIFFDLFDKYYHQKRILNFLKENEVKVNFFLDIGAHLGTYTNLILKNNIYCKVIMFEPQVKIFKRLKKQYKYKKNVKAFNYAISNKNGFRKLYINKHDLTSTFSKFNLKNKWLNYKAKLFNSTINEMIKNIEISKTVTLKKVIDWNNFRSAYLFSAYLLSPTCSHLPVLAHLFSPTCSLTHSKDHAQTHSWDHILTHSKDHVIL